MPEDNGPNIQLPNSGDLANFLDGTDQQDAVDTAVLAEHEAPEDTDETPEPPSYQETFDRKYVEKLRRENATYRERAKQAESVWEGYEEGAVNEWKQMISTYKQDPKSVAEQWKDLADTVLQQFTPQEQAEIAEAVADGEDMPLTRKEFESLLAQREQQWELNSMVQDIEQEAQELGYNLKSREYKVLLMTAQEIPSGSIQEAHEMLQAERQRIIDAYVADMEKGAGRVVPSGNTVGVPDTTKQIKDFKQAKEALSNFLDGSFR
jgi:hypothetical protein